MDYLILIFIFLFGLIIGSFLNCFIWRLHTGETLGGRSYCPKCRNQIAWHDNIPVLSFLILHGKCRNCKAPISWQYLIVELVTGILFIIAFVYNFSALGGSALGGQFLINILRDWLVIAVMIVIFIYDLRWYMILDKITLPSAVIFFSLNIFLGFNWQNLLISGIIGGGFFLAQFLISKGKWIGGGDIRMGFLMGMILGWPGILVALFLAYIIGSVFGLSLLALGKKKWGSQIPFGTFLAIATLTTLFWGDHILDWYLHLILF